MKSANRRPTHKQILKELMTKRHVPVAVKELNGDIEDAVEQAGGQRGQLRHANG